MRSSLGSVMSYSFFITKKMRSQLRSGEFTGTLPLLYVFLARAGKTINDVSLVTLDKEGVEQPASETACERSATGVKIAFAGSDGKPQTLYYFSTDMSDGGVEDSGFLKFCGRLGDGGQLHQERVLSLALGQLLEGARLPAGAKRNGPTGRLGHSGALLRARQWELRPFGHYVGPIGIFPGRYQRQLSDIFRRAPPIDFGVGYRWRLRESNLLLANKKP